jgi:membrane-bound metal-dependent hydrolase YbcI (DUF457 family)
MRGAGKTWTVVQRERQAIELQLAGVRDRLAARQPGAHASVPGTQIGLVVGVVEREHRTRVRDLGEALLRLAAHALRRRIRHNQLGMLGLERLQPVHPLVILRIGPDRRIEHVVQMLMMPQLFSQALDLVGWSSDRHADSIEKVCSIQMEPVTHILTGACLARAGLNRKAAYATVAMAVAAEFPDIDTLWSIDGPVAVFQHHRGWTHTFLGLPFEATFLLAAFWLLHRLRPRATKAPVRWPMLWLLILLALLSHLFLDWTNNYGLRPFFPFDPHWYAGSFVFIFEPVLFVALLAGLVMPSLFGLINSEVGDRRPPFRGRGWAIFALLCASMLWGWRFL